MRRVPAVRVLVFLTITGALVWRAWLLSNTPLADWDESIYARIGFELATNPSLETRYNGAAWLEKPPLVNYLLGLVAASAGQSAFWLRVTGTIFATAVLIITFTAGPAAGD